MLSTRARMATRSRREQIRFDSMADRSSRRSRIASRRCEEQKLFWLNSVSRSCQSSASCSSALGTQSLAIGMLRAARQRRWFRAFLRQFTSSSRKSA